MTDSKSSTANIFASVDFMIDLSASGWTILIAIAYSLVVQICLGIADSGVISTSLSAGLEGRQGGAAQPPKITNAKANVETSSLLINVLIFSEIKTCQRNN